MSKPKTHDDRPKIATHATRPAPAEEEVELEVEEISTEPIFAPTAGDTAPVAVEVCAWKGAPGRAPLVCPACASSFDHVAGAGKVDCPACGAPFLVPEAPAA